MKVVFATSTASVPMEGGHSILVNKGSHWPADDEVVTSHPGLFSDDPRYGMSYSRPPAEDAPVEQVTAAPGERRQVRRP